MTQQNVIVIAGNLTRAPELKNTGTVSLCRFTIANNYSVKSGAEYIEKVSFFDCVLFGDAAHELKSSASRGDTVTITGKLRQNVWEHDGEKKSKIEIIVDSYSLQKRKESAIASNDSQKAISDEDDIPF